MPRLDRILFLPDLLHANSSTLRTFDLARALTARGIEVTTIASGGRLEEKFWQAGLPLRDYYRIHRATLPYVFNGKIISLARSIEPSVVHARCPRLSPLAARLARACRVNYVVTVNSIAESRYRIKRSRRCGGIIACSQYIREWLVNNVGIPKEVITVIPNGVEIDPFKRSTDVSGALPDGGATEGASPSSFTAPVVGMIGRFASGEGHDCFLEAASQIAARVPIAQFVISGAEADGLGKVGLLKQTTIIPAFLDFRHLLASIDVLLVPSSSEGRSRLILDAMASRRPVVAAGVGENYEIIRDGENGLLVQKNDAAALAAKTLEVLSNAALRRHILDSAFESVRNDFSLARMAKDVIAFYLRVTE
jgi:glycosyltransferase involved in cell wall biosynthesis